MGYLEDIIVKKAKQIEREEMAARVRDNEISRWRESSFKHRGFTNDKDRSMMEIGHIPENCLYLLFTDPDLKAVWEEKDSKAKQMKHWNRFVARHPDMGLRATK